MSQIPILIARLGGPSPYPDVEATRGIAPPAYRIVERGGSLYAAPNVGKSWTPLECKVLCEHLKNTGHSSRIISPGRISFHKLTPPHSAHE